MSKVTGTLGFSEPLDVRLKYYANDNSQDVMNVVQHAVPIEDGRSRAQPPSIDKEGFTLLPHPTAVKDFRDPAQVEAIYAAECRRILTDLTGADEVEIKGNGILRFGEKSKDSGALNNSRPARFVHIDLSDSTAATFNARSTVPNGRKVRRFAQYNLWRVLTPPPQDVPLAVCDAQTLAPEDLIPADAIFDQDGKVLFSFEGLVIRHNPNQRWVYFADMRPDEVLVFKTHDTDESRAHHVPHGAFDNPMCPPDAPPRASIEMRATCYWYA
jgi:hypothetical protein